MFDAPYFNFLVRATGTSAPGDLHIAGRRAVLDAVRDELETLQSLSEDAAPDGAKRFDRYLDVLERKCDDVGERLGAIDADDDARLERLSAELEEARQRLAIARQAAEARFG